MLYVARQASCEAANGIVHTCTPCFSSHLINTNHRLSIWLFGEVSVVRFVDVAYSLFRSIGMLHSGGLGGSISSCLFAFLHRQDLDDTMVGHGNEIGVGCTPTNPLDWFAAGKYFHRLRLHNMRIPKYCTASLLHTKTKEQDSNNGTPSVSHAWFMPMLSQR